MKLLIIYNTHQNHIFLKPVRFRSFILDTEDDTWNEYFCSAQLDKIREHKVKELIDYPMNFVDYIDGLKLADVRKKWLDLPSTF